MVVIRILISPASMRLTVLAFTSASSARRSWDIFSEVRMRRMLLPIFRSSFGNLVLDTHYYQRIWELTKRAHYALISGMRRIRFQNGSQETPLRVSFRAGDAPLKRPAGMQRAGSQEENMHAIRRRILEKLMLRLGNMRFGFTYIERGPGGVISDASLEPFASLADCCTAAETALNARMHQPIERIEVVPCEYDGSRCHPQIMSVIRSFRRCAQ